MHLITDSAAVKAIGHDESGLHVTYKTGKTYLHAGVTAEKFHDLLKAPSKGTFLAAHISKKFPGVAK
jgi:hypothetical protein